MSDANTSQRESRKWFLYSQDSSDAGTFEGLTLCGSEAGYSQERDLVAAVRKLAKLPEYEGFVFVALKDIRFKSRTKTTTVVEVA